MVSFSQFPNVPHPLAKNSLLQIEVDYLQSRFSFRSFSILLSFTYGEGVISLFGKRISAGSNGNPGDSLSNVAKVPQESARAYRGYDTPSPCYNSPLLYRSLHRSLTCDVSHSRRPVGWKSLLMIFYFTSYISDQSGRGLYLLNSGFTQFNRSNHYGAKLY